MEVVQLGALDFCRLSPGTSSHADSIWETVRLARELEALGYSRYWLGEHHNAGIAHSSPEILMPALAGVTDRMKIGAAGILLRFYSPLKVAKNFRLLNALFPGRIDLGIAKGSAPEIVRTRLLDFHEERDYDDKVWELLGYLRGTGEVPANPLGIAPPEIWILGGSGKSNLLAAAAGTSYCMSLFLDRDDDWALESLANYRRNFVATPDLPGPHWGVAVTSICAETDEIAHGLLEKFMSHSEGRILGSLQVIPNIVGGPVRCAADIRRLSLKFETSCIILLDLCAGFDERLKSYSLLASSLDLKPIIPNVEFTPRAPRSDASAASGEDALRA